MARIVYSALVDSIRGSIGGTTFQQNAYGYTVKKKPNTINPNTPLQNRQKRHFSKATRAWRDLEQSQRDDWNTWAAAYPQYAKYNPSAVLAGYAVFTRTHVYRFMHGITSIKTNPSYVILSEDTINLSLKLDTGVLYLDVDSLLNDEFWVCLYFMSRPFSVSQTFIGTKCKFVISSENSDGSLNVTALYLAIFGLVPAVGQSLAVDLIMFNADNGQLVARQQNLITVESA